MIKPFVILICGALFLCLCYIDAKEKKEKEQKRKEKSEKTENSDEK